MKTYQEFLTEGRDAPLYHSTSPSNALSIIRQNEISATTTTGFKEYVGVSLTRSIKTAFYWRRFGVVFEIDQRKLSQDKRIEPLNIMGVAKKYGGKVPDWVYSKYEELFEERVKGSINPLSKYLTKIIIEDVEAFKHYYDNIDQTLGPSRRYKLILTHPLLYDFKTKRFVNK